MKRRGACTCIDLGFDVVQIKQGQTDPFPPTDQGWRSGFCFVRLCQLRSPRSVARQEGTAGKHHPEPQPDKRIMLSGVTFAIRFVNASGSTVWRCEPDFNTPMRDVVKLRRSRSLRIMRIDCVSISSNHDHVAGLNCLIECNSLRHIAHGSRKYILAEPDHNDFWPFGPALVVRAELRSAYGYLPRIGDRPDVPAIWDLAKGRDPKAPFPRREIPCGLSLGLTISRLEGGPDQDLPASFPYDPSGPIRRRGLAGHAPVFAFPLAANPRHVTCRNA